MRALTIESRVLTKEVPEIFSGTVKVDETYLGGQWKNKRKAIRDPDRTRERYDATEGFIVLFEDYFLQHLFDF